MVKARKYVVAKRFQGLPKQEDFQIIEEELPALKDGELLVRAEYISVDPYMRAYHGRNPLPYDQFGFQVARVVESKDPKYAVGSRVVNHVGWRDYTILKKGVKDNVMGTEFYPLPELGSLPTSLGVGAVGMPGATAYFGFLEICDPKPGETVVVTGAAGAVGSLVGQIAKIKGCRVIGFAGSDNKVKQLKERYGFDEAINYKSADIAKELKAAAPKGVDCYFDNVGGEISSIILTQMNVDGRISVCGSISAYNEDGLDSVKASIVQPSMVFKQLKMQGFIVFRWNDRNAEAHKQMAKWIQEGKIKASEHVTQGFENIVKAFVGMLQGDNIGKAVVKV